MRNMEKNIEWEGECPVSTMGIRINSTLYFKIDCFVRKRERIHEDIFRNNVPGRRMSNLN